MCDALHFVFILLSQVVLCLLRCGWGSSGIDQTIGTRTVVPSSCVIAGVPGGSDNLLLLHAFAHMLPPCGMHFLSYFLALPLKLLLPSRDPCH